MARFFTEIDLYNIHEWLLLQRDIEEVKKVIMHRKKFLESEVAKSITRAAKAKITFSVKMLGNAQMLLQEADDSWK